MPPAAAFSVKDMLAIRDDLDEDSSTQVAAYVRIASMSIAAYEYVA